MAYRQIAQAQGRRRGKNLCHCLQKCRQHHSHRFAHTKHSMLDLHPNVYFMRSPNQLIQNTYFWAHHEKLCLIDHTVAFVGGLDLCFGRWDTPDHVLVDDSPVPFHAATANSNSIYDKNQTFQMWPGKDYSNPRQQDFSQLDHPYDDMYDRQEVPRMPWHDVHMMVTWTVCSRCVPSFRSAVELSASSKAPLVPSHTYAYSSIRSH